MKKKMIRDAFGEALVEIGLENEDVVVLDADVSGSTRTAKFAVEYPERFFNVGIAEQNMVSIASGLALGGKIPFVSTFSFLLTSRALDQVRTGIAYPKLNVRIAGGYGGLSDSFDGPTHHSICDVAIMRSLPNMKVVVAADAPSTKAIVKESIKWDGPVFLRLSRAEVPIIFDDHYDFELGKGNLIQKGSDVTIIANGVMLSKALEAVKTLDNEGIKAELIEMASVKPIDEEMIVKSAQKTKAVITAEEHNVIGGLGSAVAETLAKNGIGKPLAMVGVEDTFTETGDYEELLAKYGLSANNIVEKVKEFIY
ncbi:transketolase family protein [Iocasia frigidifontis]|uniref:Transketolase family protein n=1 Tax=Iocasia fonsfrigidae TaxID=2682810 RepID=A0A8A7KKS8_9FIRM|nr:transketolase family protein [Iocasia fonsfrigidae]QTL99447.1 transketolase family protein [Iocasia fonsfrigidae]